MPMLPIKARLMPASFMDSRSLTTPSSEMLSDTQYQYTASGVSSGTFRNDSRIRAIEGVSQAASRHETEKAATASSNNEIRFITILHLQVRSPPKGYQN